MALFRKRAIQNDFMEAFARMRHAEPEAWDAAIQMADEMFETRTPYLRETIRTQKDVNKYVTLACEQMVQAIERGEVFDTPLNGAALLAFNTSLNKRLRDLFADELRR